jgi:hypothetical protein
MAQTISLKNELAKNLKEKTKMPMVDIKEILDLIPEAIFEVIKEAKPPTNSVLKFGCAIVKLTPHAKSDFPRVVFTNPLPSRKKAKTRKSLFPSLPSNSLKTP